MSVQYVQDVFVMIVVFASFKEGNMEFLIYMIIVLIIIGAALYILRLLPIDTVIKNVIYVLIIVVVLIWVLLQLPRFLPH